MSMTDEQLKKLIFTSPLSDEERRQLTETVGTLTEDERSFLVTNLRGLQLSDIAAKAQNIAAARDDLDEDQKAVLVEDLTKSGLLDIKRKEDQFDLQKL